MTETAPDIVVAGAGPVGLAASLLLHQTGQRVVLVAPPRERTDHRTSALMAGSVSLLQQLEVWPELAAQAAPLRTLRIVDATGRLMRAPEVSFHAGEIGLEAFGYNMPNATLIATLEQAADRRRIPRFADAVEAVEPGEASVAVALSDGTRLEARLVVAADGRDSHVRESLGIPVNAWRYDQSALVLNVRHTVSHDDTSTEFHTPEGPFTLVPLPGNRSSLVWVGRPSETTRRLALDDAALAAEIEARSASILGAITIDGPRQAFPLSGMTALRLAGSRGVLLGEAAHLFPPIGAQGLNLGYRDVAELGRLVTGVSDPGSQSLLAAYDAARRRDVFSRTAAVDALNRTLLTGFLPVQGLRGLGLFMLDRIPSLRRAVMRRGVAA